MSHISVQNVHFYYHDQQVLRDVSLSMAPRTVTAVIGPSGCGKSTFLRLFNKMNDLIDGARLEGTVMIDGKDIYEDSLSVHDLRKQVGMVFQKPNPFPKSIFENVAFGLRIRGEKNKHVLAEAVERSLRQAALWEEVKHDLHRSAFALSGGQQQRLCIARALAVEPSILLMDEPVSALDPISAAKIEELIFELKKKYTIVIVTHNMQQAARVSDTTAFLYMGELLEYGETSSLFTNPQHPKTQSYITGRFG